MNTRHLFTKTTIIKVLASFSIVMSFSTNLEAQRQFEGTPASFQQNIEGNIATHVLSPLDIGELLREEELGKKFQQGMAFKYGKARPTNLTLQNAGSWEKGKEGGVWRLKIKSPNAYSLNLTFKDFFIPPGGRLFLYSPDRGVLLGAFTQKNNRDNGRFGTIPIRGDEVILEYNEPLRVSGLGTMTVSSVVHAYKDDTGNPFVRTGGSTKLMSTQSPCFLGINCNIANSFQDEKRAVVRITTSSGDRCTGTLVGTTDSGSYIPYVLTARHCKFGDGDPQPGQSLDWTFLYNYESSSNVCQGSSSSSNDSSFGATIVAQKNFSHTDGLLLQLDHAPLASFNSYYAGWSRIEPATGSHLYGVHHPGGAVKKFVRDLNYIQDPLDVLSFRTITEWENYDTAEGSSGSALFDANGRIIGQLHANFPGRSDITCDKNYDWYGDFNDSWSGSNSSYRFKDWLDPVNSNALSVNGKEGPSSTLLVEIQGPETKTVGQSGTWTATASGGTGSGYSYNWQFRPVSSGSWSNGNPWASGNVFSRSFSSAGGYYIKVTVTNGGQNDSDTFYTLYKNAPPPPPYSIVPEQDGGDVLEIKDAVLMGKNYPNPFNPTTQIIFTLEEEMDVKLHIYDTAGKRVKTLVSGMLQSGMHEYSFDATGLPGGVYIASLRSKYGNKIMRMTLLK